MIRVSLLALLITLLTGSGISAQSYLLQSNLKNIYTSDETAGQLKDPIVASALSVGVPATAVTLGWIMGNSGQQTFGVIMISAGILIGPSAGNIYAEANDEVLRGILYRTAGGALLVIGTALSINDMCIGSSSCGGGSIEGSLGTFTALLGAGIIGVSAVYDFFNASKNAHEYNNNRTTQLTFGPTYFPRESVPGVSLNLRF
tara:strand:+ start:133348 stop:133953 length:606 start_codon:yes stop_codon:yes gene_type:complete